MFTVKFNSATQLLVKRRETMTLPAAPEVRAPWRRVIPAGLQKGTCGWGWEPTWEEVSEGLSKYTWAPRTTLHLNLSSSNIVIVFPDLFTYWFNPQTCTKDHNILSLVPGTGRAIRWRSVFEESLRGTEGRKQMLRYRLQGYVYVMLGRRLKKPRRLGKTSKRKWHLRRVLAMVP